MKNFLTNSFVPKYEQIKRIFRDEISRGKYKVGDQIPSENELPKIFSVSRHTVLKAINDLVNESLLSREQGKGTFVVATEREKETNFLKVLMPLSSPPKRWWYLEELMEGTKRFLQDIQNYQLVFDFVGKKTNSLQEILELAHIKGLILLIPYEESKYLLEHANAKIPVVVTHYFAQEQACIKIDNIAGGFKAVSHLIRLGHKRIGYLRASDSFDSSERFEGYKKALQEHQIPFEKGLIEESSPGKEGAYLAVRRLLQSPPLPTAIFAPGYFMALGTMEAIKEIGLKIPEDIALIGFDDHQINPAPTPALTTVKQPIFEMGYQAVEMLFALIKGNLLQERQRLLEPKLIIRESCGAYLKK